MARQSYRTVSIMYWSTDEVGIIRVVDCLVTLLVLGGEYITIVMSPMECTGIQKEIISGPFHYFIFLLG